MAKPKLSVTSPDDDDRAETVEDQWECGSRTKPGPVKWLVPGLILHGSLAMLEGHKGSGKSTLLCALAAAVTQGKAFVGRKRLQKGAVLWSAREEDTDNVLSAKLLAAGADMSLMRFPAKDEHGMRRRIIMPGSVAMVRQAIDRFGVRLLVLDPLSAHVPSGTDLRNDQQIHEALDPLAELAHVTGCTCVVTRNLVKGRGVDRLHAGLGGAAVGGVARSVLAVDWPGRAGTRRVVRLVACNLAPDTLPLEYHIIAPGGWGVVSGLRQLAASPEDEFTDMEEPEERDQRENACELLKALLTEGNVDVQTIAKEAENAAISVRTLRRAKTQLRIRHRRIPGSSPAKWEWMKPKGGF